jgi:hypothetical protein
LFTTKALVIEDEQFEHISTTQEHCQINIYLSADMNAALANARRMGHTVLIKKKPAPFLSPAPSLLEERSA